MTTSPEKIAVIDIGSNSIRLVVYDNLKRAPLPLLNEKLLCGLARDLDETGTLYAKGVKLAMQAMGRFRLLIDAMGVKDVTTFATSAVRDAKDGKDFIRQIEKEFGFEVKILSGGQEARLAALGVAAAFFEADGVVGDLGGGSLELAHVKTSLADFKGDIEHIIQENKSFPIGALRLKAVSNSQIEAAGEIVAKALAEFPLRKTLKGLHFYAVGGGLRALAKIHISRAKHPIEIVHNYVVPAEDIYQTAKWVAAADGQEILRKRLISEDRADTITFSAVVLERIIALGEPAFVSFSAWGAREGVLFDRLKSNVRQRDPLIATSDNMIKNISPSAEEDESWVKFSRELYEWMSPLFRTEDDYIRRLRLSACILSHLAWYEHTAYRAEMAFRWVLDSSIPAISHEDRVFIATAVFHRYKAELDLKITGPAQKILPGHMAFRARVVGLAARLGFKISGTALGVLPKTRLELTKSNTLILHTGGMWLSEGTIKRFEKIGEVARLAVEVHED
jgi:exopolyphosphatase/guanosine-5'-triphosphate,3'-diphosphate pyrophosphatase